MTVLQKLRIFGALEWLISSIRVYSNKTRKQFTKCYFKLTSFFGGFFASGGTVKPGKAHVVGDGGEPELFVPNSVGSVIPFSKLQGSGAGGNNIVVNMNIQTPDISSFNQSRSQIAADMARQIARCGRNL